MDETKRSGIRPIEVIVLLGACWMLVGVLIPAIRSREASPRAQCMNNQRLIALAILNFDGAKRRFPGYKEHLCTKTSGEVVEASWVVMLFPYMECSPIYNRWRDPDKGTPVVYLPNLTCPSNHPEDTGPEAAPLAYVANCGKPGDRDTAADGVFHNRMVQGDPVHVSVDYIAKHDGTSYTLLLSENLQAGRWTDTTEASVGMLWFDSPGKFGRINAGAKADDLRSRLETARPSSRHPGGVNVSFCDGHIQFLSDDMYYGVYQLIMTPYGEGAGVPGILDPGDLR